MLSFTKKNNTHPTVAAQTVEPASSSAAAAPKEPSSSSIKKNLFLPSSAPNPYRNHARLSPSSSFASPVPDHTQTTTTHHINRYSRYDSLLPIVAVVVPSSASAPACPELSPTSSFSSSLESQSLTTLEDGEVAHPHAPSTYTGTADADKGAKTGLTRADRVRVQQRRPASARRSPTPSSCSANSNSDSPSSFPIWTIVPASVTNSSFVGRPWEQKGKGREIGQGMGVGMGEGYSKEAVEAIRRGSKTIGAERCGFAVSRVPVEVSEGECEVVVG